MKAFALGLVVMLCTLLLGLAVGTGVFFALAACGVASDLAQSIGLVGVWWLSAIVLFGYANIWLDPFGRLGNVDAGSSSTAVRQRTDRPKAQTAAIRGAVLFAMIGGLAFRWQSPAVIVAVALGCGVLGWLFGADYKRRVNRSLNRGELPGEKSSNASRSGRRPREAARK